MTSPNDPLDRSSNNSGNSGTPDDLPDSDSTEDSSDGNAPDLSSDEEQGSQEQAASSSVDFEDVADEFAEALNTSNPASIDEYLSRYPQFESEIRDLFPLILRMHVSEPSQGVPLVPFDEPPKRIGEYRILREIGRGGMGVVYEAIQESLGRKVALKLLPPVLSSNEKLKARFEREAQAAASLHHTNIVPVFSFGEVDGHHYYAMQYIRGQAASEWLHEHHSDQDSDRKESGNRANPTQDSSQGPRNKRGPTWLEHSSSGSASRSGGRYRHRRIASIGQQVADALAYAHDQGVLHRDIKPSNLLIDSHETVWITDFGLAKTLDGADLTESGDVLGTLRYMPPEAFSGKVDYTADIYSLGLTLYEFLLGRPAFEAQSREQLIQNVTTGTVTPLRRLDSSVPRDLETIIERATNSDPKRRFLSAREMADDLRRFRAGEPIRARQVTFTEKAIKWGRRHPAVALLWFCLALAITVGAAGVVWKWRDAEVAKSDLQFALKQNTQSLDRATRALKTSKEITNVMVRLIAASDDYGLSSMLTSSGEIAVPGRSTEQALNMTEAQMHSLEDVETRDLLVSQLAVVRVVRGEINEAAELLDKNLLDRRPSADEIVMLAFVQFLQGRYGDSRATIERFYPQNTAESAKKKFLLAYFQMHIDENEESVRAAELALEQQLKTEQSNGKRLNQQFLFHAHLALIRLRRSALDADRFAYENSRERQHFVRAAEALVDVNRSPLYESVFPLGTGLYQQESGWRWNNKLLIGTGRSMANSGIEKLAETFGSSSPLRALVMEELGGFYVNMSELHDYPLYLEDAARVLKFALEGAETLCPGEPRTADVQYQLAQVLVRQGEESEAIPLLQDAISIRSRILGESHSATVAAQELLASIDHGSWRYTFAHLINVSPRNYVPYGSRIKDIAFRFDGSNLVGYSHLHDRNAGSASFAMVTNWESEDGHRLDDFKTVRTGGDYRSRPAMLDASGQRLVLVSERGRIHVVDTVTGREICRSAASSERAQQVLISGDGSRIATSSTSEKTIVQVWQIEVGENTLKPLASVPAKRRSVFALDHQGLRLAIAEASAGGFDEALEDRVRIVDLATEEVVQFDGLNNTSALEFAPQGERLAIASTDGQVVIVSLSKPRAKTERREISQNATGQGSAEPTESLGMRSERVTSDGPAGLSDLAWSTDGRRLAGAGAEAVTLWSAEGEVIANLEAPKRFGDLPFDPRVAMSPDGTKIAAVQPDHTINIWSSRSPDELARSPLERGLAGIQKSIDASPQDPWLLSRRGYYRSQTGDLRAAFDDYVNAKKLLAGDEPCLLIDDQAFIKTPPLDVSVEDGYTMEAWVKHWNFMQPAFVYGVIASIDSSVSKLAGTENSNLKNIFKLHTDHTSLWLRGVGRTRTSDRWVHLAVVNGPDERRYYVDGVRKAATKPLASQTELGELYIGTTSLHDPIAKGRGLIRSLRVSQGEVYVDNFEPTDELVAEPSTVLLLDFTEGRYGESHFSEADGEPPSRGRQQKTKEKSARNLRIVPDRSPRRNHGQLHNAWWLGIGDVSPTVQD